MSATFANLSVRADSDEDILAALAGEDTFVSPPMLGWVTVFDRESDAGNLSRLADLAVRLSGTMDATAIAMLVIDDDAFFYLLFRSGELIDEYASDPELFGDLDDGERNALAGDVQALLALAIDGTRPDHLRAILSETGWSGPQRARELADRLGIQNAGLGYEDLIAKAEGADIPVVGWDLFEHTGDDEFEDAEPAAPSPNGWRT